MRRIRTVFPLVLAVSGATTFLPASDSDRRAELEAVSVPDDGPAENRDAVKPAPEPQYGPLDQSDQSLRIELEETEEEHGPYFQTGPIELLEPVWESMVDPFKEWIGLKLGLAYTMLYQHATEGSEPRDAGAGDVDLLGRWTLWSADEMPGVVSFGGEWRHSFADTTPFELRNSFGSLWRTTAGFNTQTFRLVELWFEQDIIKDRLELRVGKINPNLVYDTFAWKGENSFFINQAFSLNPAIGYPQNGLGVVLGVSIPAPFYAILGSQDANAVRTQTGFETIDKSEFFTAAEVGLRPETPVGRGRYHVLLWHSDRRSDFDLPSGHGVSVLAEQAFGEKFLPFVRYSYSSSRATIIQQMAAAGLGINDTFGFNGEALGVGFAWGEPSDRKLRDQYIWELFYRMQVTPRMRITPDVQFILNPSRSTRDDFVTVVGVRLRVAW